MTNIDIKRNKSVINEWLAQLLKKQVTRTWKQIGEVCETILAPANFNTVRVTTFDTEVINITQPEVKYQP